MKEIDYNKLDLTINDFESTVGSLKLIDEMSKKVANGVETMKALTSGIRDTDSSIKVVAQNLEKVIKDFYSNLQKSADDLLAIRDDIKENNEEIVRDVSDNLSELRSDLEAKEQESSKKIEKIQERTSDTLIEVQRLAGEIVKLTDQVNKSKKASTIGAIFGMIAAVASLVSLCLQYFL